MKVIMAVSADGYLARGPSDDMSWTGQVDKAIFRMLTTLNGGELGAGSVTYDAMPSAVLHGRMLHRLSRKPRPRDGVTHDLAWFHHEHPTGWLIGGQAIVIEALKMRLVDEVVMVHLDRMAFTSRKQGGVADGVSVVMMTENRWNLANEVGLLGTRVRIYRKEPHRVRHV